MTVTGSHEWQNYAPHVHFTSLVSSMPQPTNASVSSAAGPGEASAAEGTAAAPAAKEHISNLGFVSYKPEQGLSGGAVLDSNCSLVGIIERRSLWAPSGRFVRLTDTVLGLLRGALCWGNSTFAC